MGAASSDVSITPPVRVCDVGGLFAEFVGTFTNDVGIVRSLHPNPTIATNNENPTGKIRMIRQPNGLTLSRANPARESVPRLELTWRGLASAAAWS